MVAVGATHSVDTKQKLVSPACSRKVFWEDALSKRRQDSGLGGVIDVTVRGRGPESG